MMHNLGSQGQHDAQPWIPWDLVGVPSRDPRGPVLDAVPSMDSIGAGTGWSCGPGLDAQPWIRWDLVGVPSSDQHRPGQQQQQSPREGTRCSSLDSCVGMMHNPRSHGTWLDSHRVINTDRASNSSNPHGRGLDAVPSIHAPA